MERRPLVEEGARERGEASWFHMDRHELDLVPHLDHRVKRVVVI
jgi:hypothetical protein